MPPDCVLTQPQGLCWCGAQAVAYLLLWAVCGKLCRCTCTCVHQFGTCRCQYMIACVLYCGLLHTAGEHSCGSAAGVGLWGWAVLGRQQVRWPTPPTMHACQAAKQPTSATHQHPRTALQHRPPNMFPTPLGVVFQPLLTALHLEVSVLSCTKRPWTFLHAWLVFRPKFQRLQGDLNQQVGRNAQTRVFLPQGAPPPGRPGAVWRQRRAHRDWGAERARVGWSCMGSASREMRERAEASCGAPATPKAISYPRNMVRSEHARLAGAQCPMHPLGACTGDPFKTPLALAAG